MQHPRLLSICVLAAMLLGKAQASEPSAAGQAQCQRWADEEGLKGEARDSYLRRCQEEQENDALPASGAGAFENPLAPTLIDPDSLFQDPPPQG